MKKTLLALAVSAALVPIAAQADTQFYGFMGVSLNNRAVDTAPANTIGNNVGDLHAANIGGVPAYTRFDEGSWQLNNDVGLLGVRGSVPLYNDDVSFIWQVERGIDLGGTGDDLYVRNSYVGLASVSYGRLFFGTYDSPVKRAGGSADLFGNFDFDMGEYLGGQNRVKNSINYISPSLAGITFSAQIRPGEGERTDGTGSKAASEHGLADGYSVAITYKVEGYWAGLGYEKGIETQSGTIGSISGDIDPGLSTLRAAAGVTLGKTSLAAIYQRRDADKDYTKGVASDAQAKNDFLVSAAYELTTKVRLKAQYTQSGGVYLADGDDRKLNVYLIGANYELGKNIYYRVFAARTEVSGDDNGVKDDAKYNVAGMGITYAF